MDFLDPTKKRAHAIRLAIGQTLIGLAILIGTSILVYQAYGFDVDRKTGEVFQNGLVFIDSAPDGAEIKLNGLVNKEITNTRVSLPEGKYDLEINKEGYRTWKKTFRLDGGSIERFVYPTLFLNELSSTPLQQFNKNISFTSQSPDRRWVLIAEENNLNTWTEYDLNTLQEEKPVSRNVTLPTSLFSEALGKHSLKLVEWSTDNKNILIKHTFRGGSEFVVVNRDKPEESYNVNRIFGQAPALVRLRDKKVDELYVLDKKNSLKVVKVENGQAAEVAKGVLRFEPHGKDVLAIVATSAQDPGKIQFTVRDDTKNYTVKEIDKTKGAEIAIAEYDGDWYLGAHDPKIKRTYIYRNPVEFLNKQPDLKPAPVMVLRVDGVLDDLNFSQNTQFISARSGQNFAVYDNEYGRAHRFTVNEKFDKDSEVEWMDGHRFIAKSKGSVFLFEFDGQNKQTLVPSFPGLPVTFNRDYTALYTLSKSDKSKTVFSQTFLRLEEDR